MSMLSAQRDRLRTLADHLDERERGMDEYVRALRDAADTIWELRCKLAGTVDQSDEIDRLKEQVRWLKKGDVLHVLTDQELADHQKHEREMHTSIAALNDENVKLRELVRHLYEYRQLYFKTGIYPTDHGVTEQRMRELRIEVDE